jgi:hypothetical protein
MFATLAMGVWSLGINLGCCPSNKLSKHPGCDLKPEKREQHRVHERALGDCQAAICGSNSPYVNTFPFNGLNPAGCINADGYALKATSARTELVPVKGHCGDEQHPEQMYLDIASAEELSRASTPMFPGVHPPDGSPRILGWQLVARNAAGAVICAGSSLAGATFNVISKHESATLLIAHVAMAEVTYLRTPRAINECKSNCNTGTPEVIEKCKKDCEDPAREGRLAYLITNNQNAGRSLCTRYSRHHHNHPADIDPPIERISPLFTSSQDHLWNIQQEELASYTVVIPGQVYDDNGSPIDPAPGGSDAPLADRWFNLACAGDGLAQSDLGGVIAPEPGGFKPNLERQEAIHMFTAQYGHGASATVGGTPIAWKTNERKSRSLEDKVPFLIEAEWGDEKGKGATCVYHSRLWMNDRVIPFPPDIKAEPSEILKIQHEEDFLGKFCKPNASCKSKSVTDDVKVLTSYVRGHTAHPPPDNQHLEPIPPPCTPVQ